MFKSMKQISLIILVLLMTLSGCSASSDKVSEAINPSESQISEAQEQNEIAKGIELSDKELTKIVDELTKMTAEKYGTTKEEYIAVLESEGKTPYDAFKLAADQMGITIKEFYEQEMSGMDNMSDEQKETVAAMAAAVEEASNTVESEGAIDAVEAVTGVHTNTSGGIRIVEGDYDELVQYKLIEVTQAYEDEYSLVTDYITEGEIKEVVDYFDQLIFNTEGYIKVQQPGGSDTIFQGMINDYPVVIDVTQTGEGVLVATYLDLTSKQ